MPGVFELFHLSLLEKSQISLFEIGPRPSREEWLRIAFGRRFMFEHRRKKYHWVPAQAASDLIAGNVVRSHRRRHHKPPEEGATEIVSDEWQGAMIIIDPATHDDGQKVSFERDETIGKPRSVLPSMLAYVNGLPEAPYVIEPKPIFDKASFWDWAAAHEYRLRRISFEFIVPNMFGSKSALDEDLRDLGKSGVSRVRVQMDEGNRAEGIDAQNQQVRDGIEYAAQGGGDVTATAKNGDRFNSNKDAKTARLPTSSADATGGIQSLTKWFQRLLGREQDDSLDGDSGDAGGSPGG